MQLAQKYNLRVIEDAAHATESVYNGKKIGTNKGEVEIRFDSKINLDWKEKWGKNYSIFQRIYDNYIIRDKIEAHKTDLHSKVYSLYDEVKKYLEMYGV